MSTLLTAVATAYVVAPAVLSLLLIFRLRKQSRAVQLAAHRVAYRRGIAAGYARCERKWRHRKAVELHDADRLSDARPDAGPAAHVSKIRFQSGK